MKSILVTDWLQNTKKNNSDESPNKQINFPLFNSDVNLKITFIKFKTIFLT